jgi:hypothetical protein
MTNTGRVRVNKAIAVPTMSANLCEYVSAELADGLFEFIQYSSYSDCCVRLLSKETFEVILASFKL